jgi:AraC-like DNA-binding protein/ferredoxin
MSLVFISSVVFDGMRAVYSVVTGPVVMGLLEDVLNDNGGAMADALLELPRHSPSTVGDISHVQLALCMFMSGRSIFDIEKILSIQVNLQKNLREETEKLRLGQSTQYPYEIEHRLRRMITQGDKKGAQDLINQLLGTLYFNSKGEFHLIKERARELVVLFSRASIEGGADVQKIFGQNRDHLAEIDHFHTLDELSAYLTSIFYRFVGYVFDFDQFEHNDIIHKAVNYLRENFSEKVTLEDLASHVCLSRSYLSAIFKAELGLTFSDYLNSMRVEKSKELLLNPKLSLAEIACQVGYTDQSYYTKVFARQTGISPGQFRKSAAIKKGENPSALVTIVDGRRSMSVNTHRGCMVEEVIKSSSAAFETPCGGRHACGRCAVWVKGAFSQITPLERALLAKANNPPLKDAPKNYSLRLACMCRVEGDGEIRLLRDKKRFAGIGVREASYL